MDGGAARIVGRRALPCHGGRLARLDVGAGTVVRSCPVCGKKYAVSFVAQPELSARVGLDLYSLSIAPWVDGRTRRRLERERSRATTSPPLPFDETWRELRA